MIDLYSLVMSVGLTVILVMVVIETKDMGQRP